MLESKRCRLLFTLMDGAQDCSMGRLDTPFPGMVSFFLNGEIGWYNTLFLIELKTGKALLNRRLVNEFVEGKRAYFEMVCPVAGEVDDGAHSPVRRAGATGVARRLGGNAQGAQALVGEGRRMNEYALSPAELAVLLNHMTGGRLLEGKAYLRDLPVGEQAWAEVEESLLDRGMLLVLPFEEASGVTLQLASVLSAALTPGWICIVRAVHEDRADPPVTFSFTPECITRSYVDAQGRHILAEIADQRIGD
jgi:hypothetical protein